jgi:hypothetical protein
MYAHCWSHLHHECDDSIVLAEKVVLVVETVIADVDENSFEGKASDEG